MQKVIDGQNTTPLVSVILPTYNGARFIEETLQSVIDQTYKNLEIIIIDDCSTDNSYDILKLYADKDDRIKLYKNDKNLGIGENSNKALSLSNGEYIMMQDHDDLSSPVRVEAIVKVLEENRNITGCATRVTKIKGYTKDYTHDLSDPRVAYDDEYIRATEIFDRLILHPTTVYRKSILNGIDKPYSGEFKIVSDDDLFYTLNKAGARWFFLDNRYLLYREHNNRTSVSNKYLHYNERKIMVDKVIKDLLPFATDEDIKLHSIVQSRREVLSYNGELSDWAISWYKKIIAYNLESKKFNHEKLLEIMALYWKLYATLTNINAPLKAYKMYHSIKELSPYLESNGKFFKEMYKRFVRGTKWRLLGNKALKKPIK